MKLIKNNYYINWAFAFFRGNGKLIEYLSIKKNAAYAQLTKEGYNYLKEFRGIIDSYSSINSLSTEESRYIRNLIDTYMGNIIAVNNLMQRPDIINTNLKIIKNGLIWMKYSFDKIDLDFMNKISFIKINNLETNLLKTTPIYEAVTVRRCIKVLLEYFIKNNIEKIEVKNYIPSEKVINNYIKSINDNFWKKDDNIANIIKSLDDFIKKNEKCERNTNPVIKSEDETIKTILHALGKMKYQTNSLIHFKNPNEINFELNENFCPRIGENQNIDNINLSNINIQQNKVIDIQKVNFKSSDVIKYIINGSAINKINEKLNNIYTTFLKKKEEFNKIIDDNNIDNIEIDNFFQELCNDASSLKNNIDKYLKKLTIQNLDFVYDTTKLTNVFNYIDENKNSLDVIQIVNTFTEKEKEFVNNINPILLNLKDEPYLRLKLNVTFSVNLELINYKKEIDEILNKIRIISQVKNARDNLIQDLSSKLSEIEIEINDMKNKIIATISIMKLNTQDLKEYENYLLSQFENIEFDLSHEVNNFYFFIFLQKKKCYIDKVYKACNNLSE